jgi:hypothetical protein
MKRSTTGAIVLPVLLAAGAICVQASTASRSKPGEIEWTWGPKIENQASGFYLTPRVIALLGFIREVSDGG